MKWFYISLLGLSIFMLAGLLAGSIDPTPAESLKRASPEQLRVMKGIASSAAALGALAEGKACGR